jgi:hypothetical protein
MRQSDGERMRRFDALFASYSSDIVADMALRRGAQGHRQPASFEPPPGRPVRAAGVGRGLGLAAGLAGRP